jgi:uncharacterized protein
MKLLQSLLVSAMASIALVGLESQQQVFADPVPPAVPDVARPLPLTDVRVTGGPLQRAQELNAEYLLKLEPDRMLAYYRKLAGLQPKAEGYGGWDGDGRQLTGHVAGHYLSAVSLMWAATGDQRFKDRADYIVAELKEVQEANGNGFVGALENCQEQFAEVAKGNIRSGGFDLNGLWSPWYTLHKTYAGLRDAYRYTGNQTALEIEEKFSEWAEGIVANLDDAQIQKMLNTEFGGMNEVFVDLYVDTGNKRWLDLSYKFEHHAILDPLKKQQDRLAGTHGNTQVPKLIGSLARHVAIGDESDGVAARYFWDRVVNHHSFATGGHGKDEYFGRPDKLNEFVDGRTAETCNVYNMLKLTRKLFALDPDPQYAEFTERALFNHILASIDPQDGRTCYMVPVGQGVQHEYQDMFGGFTCCVGSGMESHALHGDGIYYEAGDRLWINLYVPSRAEWKSAGASLEMNTDFPEGDSATLTVGVDKPREMTLSFRRPSWAGDGFKMEVNREPVANLGKPGEYINVKREWKSRDKVTFTLPKKLRLEPLADNPDRVAIMWGPLVLAGDLGPQRTRGRRRGERGRAEAKEIPVFVTNQRPVEDWLKPSEADEVAIDDDASEVNDGEVGSDDGEKVEVAFRTEGVGREHDVAFAPFYRLHRRVYGGYWDLFTESQWEARAAEIAAERERLHKLEAATIAFAQPGNMQSERDFKYEGEEAWPMRAGDRAGRYGRGWMSFELPIDPSHPAALLVTYRGGERRREGDFKIFVAGKLVAEQRLESGKPAKFFDVEYAIPDELVAGKETVTVRFEAAEARDIGPIFGLRMIRADAAH